MEHIYIKPEVDTCRINSEGNAEVAFKVGGYRMIIEPWRSIDQNVIGIWAVELFKKGTPKESLEAVVIETPKLTGEEKGFWSRGIVSQSMLGDYLSKVIVAINSKKEEVDKDKMEKSEWEMKGFSEFWKIAQKCSRAMQKLKTGAVNEGFKYLEKIPERFIEKVK